jgi:flagellar motor protein MotB
LDEVLPPSSAKTDSHALPPKPERCVVQFESGLAVVSDDQAKVIAPIADFLKHDPKAVVRVDGHADRTVWVDNKRSNYALSYDRAAAIVRELGKLGIPRDRIRATAFGDTRPVDDRSTEEAYRRNRRVEVRIELTGGR